MPASYDFSDGNISDNILNALRNCSAKDIISLKNAGMLSFPKSGGTLKYKTLLYRGLDDYAELSGCTIGYFLFGDNDVPTPNYTGYDAPVIRALNTLTSSQLAILDSAIKMFYYCPIMEPDVYPTPSKRLLAVLDNRFGKNIPEEIPEEEKRKYHKDIMQEIHRYKFKSHHSPAFQFHSDYWPDLAKFTGVSVRWLLGVRRHALYCNSAAADDIFDLYTLVHPDNRKSFVGLLARLSSEYIPELEKIFLDREVQT